MHKIGSLITAAVFFGSCITGAIGTAVTPKEYFSEIENRSLAGLPSAEILRESAGKYCNTLDEYVSDHFVFRDMMVNAYTDYLLASGKKTVRDLLVLEDNNEGAAKEDGEYFIGPDCIFDMVYPVAETKSGWLMENISSAQEKYGFDAVYVIVPEKTIALAEATGGQIDDSQCRTNLDVIRHAAENHGVRAIEIVSDVLDKYTAEERSSMYFKTDFHWNPLGAYRAAELLAMKLAEEGVISLSSIPLASDFCWQNLTRDYSYQGDLAVRLADGVSVDEFIPLYYPADLSDFTYYDSVDGDPVPRNSVIGAGLANRDETLNYNTLTSYNSAYLRVDNPHAYENRKVLILKDSMENAANDYFTTLFSEVNVVDPRFTDATLETILEARDIDLVLFFYHENNISDPLRHFIKGE